MPIFKHGSVEAAPTVSVGPLGACVERALLPDSDEWDADVVVMDVKPGQAAPAIKAHWNNLGVLVLSGEGIFRLGDSWCVHACVRVGGCACARGPERGAGQPVAPATRGGHWQGAAGLPLAHGSHPPRSTGTPSAQAMPCGRRPTCRNGSLRSARSRRASCCTGTATSTPSSWCEAYCEAAGAAQEVPGQPLEGALQTCTPPGAAQRRARHIFHPCRRCNLV
jgi:hypothetical protein